MAKTLDQINCEFIEANNLLETVTPSFDIGNDIKQKPAELEVCSNSLNLSESIKKDFPAYTPLKTILDRLAENEKEKKKKKRKIIKLIADILLYGAIVFIVITTIIFNVNSYKGINLFGYYGFTVLSESMQSKIPEGSLVLVKDVDSGKIKIGDNITFIRKKDDSIVTHQVISIYENYGENSGKGFQTQGIENLDPDRDIIYADDIIGVVKLTIPGLGTVLNYVSVNIGFILFTFGGLTVIIIVTKKLALPNKKVA